MPSTCWRATDGEKPTDDTPAPEVTKTDETAPTTAALQLTAASTTHDFTQPTTTNCEKPIPPDRPTEKRISST